MHQQLYSGKYIRSNPLLSTVSSPPLQHFILGNVFAASIFKRSSDVGRNINIRSVDALYICKFFFFLHLSTCTSHFFLSIYLCIFLSMYLSIYLSIYVSFYLCIYLSIFLYLYLCIFLSLSFHTYLISSSVSVLFYFLSIMLSFTFLPYYSFIIILATIY